MEFDIESIKVLIENKRFFVGFWVFYIEKAELLIVNSDLRLIDPHTETKTVLCLFFLINIKSNVINWR